MLRGLTASPHPMKGEGTMYVYLKTEKELYTVGFYSPDGKFVPESDHPTSDEAAKRVAWLNGNNPSLNEALNSGYGVYRP